MSTVGRPPKPIAQKKVEGTYRADRDHGELEAEVLAEVPPPPKLLTTRAKQEWGIVCQWLFEKQLLAQTDLSLVAIYCNEVDRYWELEKSIKKHQKKAFSELVFPPKPDPPVIPEKCKAAERKAIERAYKSQLFEHGLTIVEMKEDQAFHYRRYKDCLSLQAMSKNTAKDYAIQFGFTPAARTRIKPPEKKKKSKLAELMEGL